MYAKIFEQIYDGTLVEHWQALVTFQQLLILCNQHGEVDMTPQAIHNRTGIPLKIITAGLAILETPDPQSRSQLEEGRRIVRMDPQRDWGWRLVNYSRYRRMISSEEKRESDRIRIAEKREAEKTDKSEMSQPVAERRNQSPEVAEVAQAVSSKQKQKEKELKRARPKPPVHHLIIYFATQSQTRRGIDPVIRGGPAGALVKAFLQRFDLRQGEYLVGWFLDGEICTRKGPSITLCFSESVINQWQQSGHVPPPATPAQLLEVTRPSETVSPEQVKQLLDTIKGIGRRPAAHGTNA